MAKSDIADAFLYAILRAQEGVYVYTRTRMLRLTDAEVEYVADDIGPINPTRIIIFCTQPSLVPFLINLQKARHQLLKDYISKDEFKKADQNLVKICKKAMSEWLVKGKPNELQILKPRGSKEIPFVKPSAASLEARPFASSES